VAGLFLRWSYLGRGLRLWWSFWKLLQERANNQPEVRNKLTLAGIGFSAIAVGSLLVLHVSWVSPAISQQLGVTTIRVLSICLFGPTLLGLILSAAGSGRMRLVGIGTTLITGLWWFSLSMAAAISMSAPIACHPTKFLVPEGYVGWVSVRYGEKDAPALEVSSGTRICRIPDVGLLRTSSPVEEGWAKDEYFYYSQDGSLHGLKGTGWGKGGMIWGGSNEWEQTPEGTTPNRIAQYFYVGTEEQYHRAVSSNESRPFNEAKTSPKSPDPTQQLPSLNSFMGTPLTDTSRTQRHQDLGVLGGSHTRDCHDWTANCPRGPMVWPHSLYGDCTFRLDVSLGGRYNGFRL
jgi:hypothetical protein